MEDKSQYLALMSEIIGKQSVILGPDIALLKARNVQGLTIDAKGTPTDLQGDPGSVLKALVDEYVDLSGQMPLGQTAHGWVARHLTDCVQVDRQHQSGATHACRRQCGFHTGVPGPEDNHVILFRVNKHRTP